MSVKGTIAFCSGEGHVWPGFAACLAAVTMHMPQTKLIHMIGTNIASGRNKAVRDMEGDWLWFIDTDMIFAPNTIERLLAHEVDIVQAVCLLRHPPHYPVIYRLGPDGKLKQGIFGDGPPELVSVDAVGTGGTLIRKRVFDALPDPWFKVGTIEPDELGEDLAFSRAARERGFKMFVDLTTPLGHLTPMAVWPIFHDGQWKTAYKMTGGDPVVRPAAAATAATPLLPPTV